MMVPTIHMNGDTRETLTRRLEAAHSAVREATRLVAETAPNGRNFYTQGPEAFEKAAAEHSARMAHLEAVDEELMEQWEAIA